MEEYFGAGCAELAAGAFLLDLRIHTAWSKTRRFRIFWPFWWVIAHSFGVSGRFPLPVTPGTRFYRVVTNSSFSHILAVLVGYSSQFWGSGPISCARDPRYMILPSRQKLVVFAYFGRFGGL